MRLRILLASACAVTALAATATIVVAERSAPTTIRVTLKNVNGAAVGTVSFAARSARGPVTVAASARRLKAGFHGFHVHAVGRCEAPTFMSAAGHLKATGQNHRDHTGDLSSLLAKRNGTAALRLTTDRFRLADLRDSDGSAVMVHAGADNFANVPPRYAAAGPDQATLDTGDSGARVACGAIKGARG